MNTINYENQITIENPITLPVEEILNPEEKGQLREESLDKAVAHKEGTKAQNDEERQLFVAGIAHQSKQMQAEIYLAVALKDDVNLSYNTSIMLQSLQRTQTQNNVIKAYAAYKTSPVQPRF